MAAKDPFEAVNADLHAWLLERPEQTAKALLERLQARYPGLYPDHLLRTLQRRVLKWRADIVIAFDDHLIDDDIIAGRSLPGPLRGTTMPPVAELLTADR